MNIMKKTKTLIVTETARYEFEVPASMPEDETALTRFFGGQPDPSASGFAAVTEREFEVLSHVNHSEASSNSVGVRVV